MSEFSLLAASHDRTSFSCGVDTLDSYLKERAAKDVKRGMCSVHVLAEGTTIIGFYALSPFTLQLSELPAPIAKKYPSNMLLPCWLLGRLAVDRRFQGQNYGELLLMDALGTTLTLSANAGGYCLVVDAKNEKIKPFYQKYGFKLVIDDDLRLYLPLSSIRDTKNTPYKH